MRVLRQCGTLDSLSLEVFSAIQLRTINKPSLPNPKTLNSSKTEESFIPFIPSFLSPRITSIFLEFGSNFPKAMVAPTVTTFPILCPNLQMIDLRILPMDPMTTAAVSRMLLVTDQNALQQLHVDSLFTEEADEVLYRLPDLHSLTMVIEKETSLPHHRFQI